MRTLIESFESRFIDLHQRTVSLLQNTPEHRLFWTPVPDRDSLITLSVGGAVLRSSAMVEQVFLGITRRLWDDPFEWTLPEKLSTKQAIHEYLCEVAETRARGFQFLTSDSELSRLLPAPLELRTVHFILVDAMGRSENYLGRAYVIHSLIADDPDRS